MVAITYEQDIGKAMKAQQLNVECVFNYRVGPITKARMFLGILLFRLASKVFGLGSTVITVHTNG